MRRIFKKLFLVVALAIFSVSHSVSAMPDIMPLDKIKSGMKGVAYTIIDNSGVIEPFDVKIIGLIDNGKGSAKMIMAKASGKVIEKTGGVLQGMSGSPVYVNGKLVGALSAGLKDMSPYTFFITPIESMLDIWNLPDFKDYNRYRRHRTHINTTEEIVIDEIADEKSTLLFSGFDSSGLKFLEREMKPFGFTNFYAATATASNEIKTDAKLEPGSAIGVAVVCGDFLVGATGTVTTVDGDRVLGFGHPFTHAGNVNYFMTDSEIIGSVSGENGNGVKIATVGNIIGRVNQDREAGISGIIGKFPSVVPITVNVRDNTLGKIETYNANIAYNEDLVPRLGASIAYTALSKTADSLAEGTVSVRFDIKTNAVEGGVMTRQNMFYAPADVGQSAVLELLQALTLICSNTTEESEISGIEVNMAMDSERKTATLISATPDKDLVKPGDTVNLTIKIQPYRLHVEEITIPYVIPLATKPGTLMLDIHGGALVPVAQALTSTAVVTPSTGTPEENYNEAIQKFLNTNRNNQIIVEKAAVQAAQTPKEIKREAKRLENLQRELDKLDIKMTSVSTSKLDIGYIIDNVIQVAINIDNI